MQKKPIIAAAAVAKWARPRTRHTIDPALPLVNRQIALCVKYHNAFGHIILQIQAAHGLQR